LHTTKGDHVLDVRQAGTERVAGYDPITFSVILNRFNSVANEMTLTLEHTAWTPILALCRDFSCAVYDWVPRQVCMYDALPIHTTSMQLVLQEIVRAFENDIYDGDVFACNSAYRANTHVGDLVTACPVFVNGELLFWSVTKGHQLDTGAAQPSSVVASAQNIWQEGLQIPPIKLHEKGRARADIVELYLLNMRYRDLLEGDLLAQLGSIEKGKERLLELCAEYGVDEVKRYVDAIIDYADRRMAEEVRSMPDGEYSGEGWVDTDGVVQFNIPINVKVTIDGERVTVDYSHSGPQGKGGLNGSYATSQAAGAVPFLNYIDPDIPHNHGCIRHIDVITKPGTICEAQYPASTSGATIVPSDLMQEAVHKAMATAIPERVLAGSVRCSNVPQFAGIDERSGEAWGAMLFNNTGGQGASKGNDGWPLYESSAAAGGLKAQSIEEIELIYPMRIGSMEIEPDSMGFGTWIGGPGVRLIVQPLHGDMECLTFGDSCDNPPHGVLGGTRAIGGGQYVENPATGKRVFVSAAGRVPVDRHEVWVGVSTGGGGYGAPTERDPERVRRDVRDGIVTREAARTEFGVALSDDFDPHVDAEETRRLRELLRRADRPLLDPTEPGAGTWVADNMRQGDEYLVNPQ
jgi:N-methylhydantoinase B